MREGVEERNGARMLGVGGAWIDAVFEVANWVHKKVFPMQVWNGGERRSGDFAGKMMILKGKIYFEVLNWEEPSELRIRRIRLRESSSVGGQKNVGNVSSVPSFAPPVLPPSFATSFASFGVPVLEFWG